MNPFTNGTIALWLFTNFFFLACASGVTARVAQVTLAVSASPRAAEVEKQYIGMAETAEETGFRGEITHQELRVIMVHLAYPQRYESIIRRFGSPFAQGDRYDYYRFKVSCPARPNATPDPNCGQMRLIAIRYTGRTATGWMLVDQGY